MNSTTIRIVCSGCGLRLRIDSQHSGQKFRCPKCQTVQVATTELPTTVEYVPPAFEPELPQHRKIPKTIGCLVLSGVAFLVLVAIGAMTHPSDQPEHHQAATREEPSEEEADLKEFVSNKPISMTVEQLYDQVKDNTTKARQDYTGRSVVMAGIVQEVDQGFFGAPFLTLTIEENGIFAVTCTFPRKSDTSAAHVGSPVFVWGTISGVDRWSVSIKARKIVTQEYLNKLIAMKHRNASLTDR
jgi:phage FluMu protein Com